MGEVIVKLITGEIIKISTVKSPPSVVEGFVIVKNHLNEWWAFSSATTCWVQYKPSDTGE